MSMRYTIILIVIGLLAGLAQAEQESPHPAAIPSDMEIYAQSYPEAEELSSQLMDARLAGNKTRAAQLSREIRDYWQKNSPDGVLNVSVDGTRNKPITGQAIMHPESDFVPSQAMSTPPHSLARDFYCPFDGATAITGERTSLWQPSMVTDEDGSIYMAYIDGQFSPSAVMLKRSTDAGATWSTISYLLTSAGAAEPDLFVFEGYLFVIYTDFSEDRVLCYRLDLAANEGQYTQVSLDSQEASHGRITSDAWFLGAGGYLYVAYHVNVSNSSDMFLARSTNPLEAGFSFENPVQISNHSEVVAADLDIDAGASFILHVAYKTGPLPNQIKVRKSYDGVSVAGPTLVVDESTDRHIRIAASRSSNSQVVAYTHDRGGLMDDVLLQWSADGGDSWTLYPIANNPTLTESSPEIVSDYWTNDNQFYMTWTQSTRIKYASTSYGPATWPETACQVSPEDGDHRRDSALSVVPGPSGNIAVSGYVKDNAPNALMEVATNASITSVDEPANQPTEIFLLDNYPNPFNPSTTLRYDLPESGQVQIQVVDIQGRVIAQLLSDEQDAGYHEIVWNGRNNDSEVLSTGVYFARVTTAYAQEVVKMLYLE